MKKRGLLVGAATFLAVIAVFAVGWFCGSRSGGMPARGFRVPGQGSFPGFRIADYEFAVPLPRLELTALASADDPDGFYGSGNAPVTALVFRVREGDEHHYFACSGVQGRPVIDFQYLGRNLDLRGWQPDGAGFLKVDFFRPGGVAASAWLAVSCITGSQPESAAGEPLAVDRRRLAVQDYDREFFENRTFDDFLTAFRELIRRDDREAIAGLIRFPVEISGREYFTRAEFIRDYPLIFTERRRAAILEAWLDDVSFSWRGAGMPGGLFLNATAEKAGPILNFSDE